MADFRAVLDGVRSLSRDLWCHQGGGLANSVLNIHERAERVEGDEWTCDRLVTCSPRVAVLRLKPFVTS